MLKMPGEITGIERRFLRDIATRTAKEFFPGIVVVNVGVWKGASCYCLRAGAPQAALLGIDIQGDTFLEGTSEQLQKLNMLILQENSNAVRLRGPIHLAFIDGGHEYRTVVGDIATIGSLVVPGGYIVFHDARQSIWSGGIEKALKNYMGSQWEELGEESWARWFRVRWFKKTGC